MSEEITFASWLRLRRKELSITQEELAKRLDISWITLRKLESGERHPSGQIALLLAEHLLVPIDERQAFVAFARTDRQASGEASRTAPWRNTLVRQTNLPALLTSLIGREREVAAALEQLRNPRTRLLTLIGAPGIGKTRLGLQVAFDLLASFEDGVFFVDLSSVMDPELVLPTIARTFGLKETANQPLQGLLLDYLRQRRTLLLLDNFEQVLDACTEVVKLMEASPWLKVLITSREALHVRGERRFMVPPLAVPDPNRMPGLEALMSYSSIALFVERVQDVAPDFTFSEANAEHVAVLCAGLEGLPLAIEIAASRADQLSPLEMRSALADRLKLLRAETRDLPARQRTLRGAIRWSYDLLSREAQRLFRHLGVFVGGFAPEAIDAIQSVGKETSSTDGERQASPTLEMLYTLVNRSLLRQRGEAEISGEGEVRFWMLETIREYASESLSESGEAALLHKQHALYFMRLAEETERLLTGPEQHDVLNKLEAEHDNLRAALRWAVATTETSAGQTGGVSSDGTVTSDEPSLSLAIAKGNSASEPEPLEIGLRTAGALWHFWDVRGNYSEGRVALQKLLELAGTLGLGYSREVRMKALNAAAELASSQGDYAAALAAAEEALAIGRELSDKDGIATSLNILGRLARIRGDLAAATPLFEECLALKRDMGDKAGIALSLTNLGVTSHFQGDFDFARALHEESLALRRELGDKRGLATTLRNLGLTVFEQGDYTSARSFQEESLALSRELGDRRGASFSLNNLGLVAMMEHDLEAAQSFHEESLAIRREFGDKPYVAYSLQNLGVATFGQGDYQRARALYEEGLALQREVSNKVGIAHLQCHLANALYMLGEYDSARSLHQECLGIFRELDHSAIAWCLSGLGAVLASENEPQKAQSGARLLGAAAAIAEAQNTLLDVEDLIVIEHGTNFGKAQLGEAGFDAAWQEGRGMAMEEALAYALEPALLSSAT